MNKAPEAFRTISEVAEDLDLPQHVLRFWETRFSQIKPMKRGGGRRYYRPEDVDLLRGIKHLLYEEGYTIRGLQRILKEQGNKLVIGVGRGEIEPGIEANTPEPSQPEAPRVAEPEKQQVEDQEDEASPPRGKRAVPVSEITNPKAKGGILNKLRGDPSDEISGSGRALSVEDRRSLQATLYELLECKRLLDQVRGN